MNYLSLIVLGGLLASDVCAAGNSDQQQMYKVESIESLSLSEIWALGDAQRVEVGDLVVLSQKYDAEYGFARSGLKYCAVFMVGSTDLGSRPIGFRVLTRRKCDSVLVAKDAGSASTKFSVDIGSTGIIQVQVSVEGAVRINGRTRGKLQR